ncbi:MAG: hypothetical protein LBN24_11495 [Mediterranea sp.]|jgi:hypothetical protein|nr:hypothetical protein [Mediterranea sp.]
MKILRYSKLILPFILLMGVLSGGCEASGNDTDAASDVDVMLTITVKQGAASTRTDAPTAGNRTPLLDHVWALFVEDGLVLVSKAGTLVEDGSGNKMAIFNNIPKTVKKIHVIGYPTATSNSPDMSFVGINSTEANALKTMVNLSRQDDADATKVNTYGSLETDFNSYPNDASVELSISVAPVVARIEIAKVEAATTIGGEAVQGVVTRFDLDAIYLNNTYRSLALDRKTKPNVGIVNYGGNDVGNSSPWGAPDSYYTKGCYDVVGGTGKASYTPSVAGNRWAYYATPLAAEAGSGTTINGEVQTVLPHVLLKLSNIEVGGHITSGPLFLTVKQYKDKGTGLPVTELLPGLAYVMSLSFGFEHLSPLPEVDATDITVEVEVKDWENTLIEDVLN